MNSIRKKITICLMATVLAALVLVGASSIALNYRSTVATVDQSGTITAVAIGGATITATCDGKTFTCEVGCIW